MSAEGPAVAPGPLSALFLSPPHPCSEDHTLVAANSRSGASRADQPEAVPASPQSALTRRGPIICRAPALFAHKDPGQGGDLAARSVRATFVRPDSPSPPSSASLAPLWNTPSTRPGKCCRHIPRPHSGAAPSPSHPSLTISVLSARTLIPLLEVARFLLCFPAVIATSCAFGGSRSVGHSP